MSETESGCAGSFLHSTLDLGLRLSSRAFTLIEMILAVGVAALVLAVVGGVFFTALHLRDVTQAAVDSATPVDQALAVMRRDLECAVTPTNGTSKILSGDFRVGTLTSPGISQPVAIEMFTATGALRDDAPWGDIQKVTYELRDPTDRNEPGKDLYRSVTRNLMATTPCPTWTTNGCWAVCKASSFPVSTVRNGPTPGTPPASRR